MTHREKLVFLIQKLQEDSPYRGMEIPEDSEKQKRLLRTLMNIRAPQPVDAVLLKIQDEYLQEEIEEKGIVDGDELPAVPGNRRLVLWKGDITTLKTDAIVNAANSALRGCFVPCHGCIDNVIHSACGMQLRLLCDEIMTKQGQEEPTGQAKITPAFNLPCRYILHTVGPIVSGSLKEIHCEQLAGCYRSCLELAAEQGLKSVAFCCISTGEFHFPKKEAAEIAVKTVTEYLEQNAEMERVIFDVYTEEDYQIYRQILNA